MAERVAELRIRSTRSGVEVSWSHLAPKADESRARTEMRSWCEKLATQLEGEASSLELNLHRVHSEWGDPVPLGFGFERRRQEHPSEVDKRAADLIAEALRSEWN